MIYGTKSKKDEAAGNYNRKRRETIKEQLV